MTYDSVTHKVTECVGLILFSLDAARTLLQQSSFWRSVVQARRETDTRGKQPS